MSDLKFGTDELNEGSTYRDKLIEFIKMDMTRDGREYAPFKRNNGILAYASYVALIENGCTQRRALVSVSALGADVLYCLEESDIDKDKYNACRSVIPKILLSNERISQILKSTIVDKTLLVIDGKVERAYIWDDVHGFVYGFADRYNLEGSSVFAVTFWLGLDKLIASDELYYSLEDIEEVVTSIELAKSLTSQINKFNDVILHLNDGGFLF